MKIGVSAYSFSQYIAKKKMTQFDTIKKAKEIGFDAIEFTDLTPPDGVSVEEYAENIRKEAEKVGIEISAYAVGACFALKDENKRKEEVRRIQKCVDIAHILGASVLRHDVMYTYEEFRTYDDALPAIAECTREVTAYAAEKGIRTAIENHGLICQEPERLERLVQAVNHENFGLLTDIGNFMCADLQSELCVARLANLTVLVHAKDFVKTDFYDVTEQKGFVTRACNRLMGVSVGEGDVRAKQCFAALKQAGFDGYADVEYEGAEDCVEGVKKSLAFLREITA